MSTDERTPRGAWRLASMVSSPKVPAVSKPVQDEDGHEEREREGREHVAVLRVLGTERLGEDVRRLMIREEQQDQREHQHAQDLGRDPDVVERRHEAYAERVDEGRDDQGRDGDEGEHVADAQR
jgi:hypothetical protein